MTSITTSQQIFALVYMYSFTYVQSQGFCAAPPSLHVNCQWCIDIIIPLAIWHRGAFDWTNCSTLANLLVTISTSFDFWYYIIRYLVVAGEYEITVEDRAAHGRMASETVFSPLLVFSYVWYSYKRITLSIVQEAEHNAYRLTIGDWRFSTPPDDCRSPSTIGFRWRWRQATPTGGSRSIICFISFMLIMLSTPEK